MRAVQRARSLALVLSVLLSLASIGAGCGAACRSADLAPATDTAFVALFAEGGRSALVRLDTMGNALTTDVGGTPTAIWADEASRVSGSFRLGLAPLLPWGARATPVLVVGDTDLVWIPAPMGPAMPLVDEARVGGARDVIDLPGEGVRTAIVTGPLGITFLGSDGSRFTLDVSSLSSRVSPGPWRMGLATGAIVVGIDRADETESGTTVEPGAVAVLDYETRALSLRQIVGLARCREVASGATPTTEVAVMCLGDGTPNSAGIVVLDLTEPLAPVERARWTPAIPTHVPSHDLAYEGGDVLLFVSSDATEERLVALDLASASAATLLTFSRQRDAETPAIGAAVWNATTLLVTAGPRGLLRFAIPEGGDVRAIDPAAGAPVDVGCARSLDALEVRRL